MASVPAVLPPLTTAEYKEIYALFLPLCYNREAVFEYIGKCLSQVTSPDESGLHVLIVGPDLEQLDSQCLPSAIEKLSTSIILRFVIRHFNIQFQLSNDDPQRCVPWQRVSQI
ncbi:unnamed protein product [Rotaria sp. Silwood1]|nr:unnamed protein product [Rotaria sp. Silwood1]